MKHVFAYISYFHYSRGKERIKKKTFFLKVCFTTCLSIFNNNFFPSLIKLDKLEMLVKIDRFKLEEKFFFPDPLFNGNE